MTHPSRLIPLVLIIASLACPAVACLWDRDTVRDEERGLPGMKELVAGKWERHSRLYYEDRVRRMTRRIADSPADLAAYDDLAVAYEKLDDRDAAIATMLRKEGVKPGLYTTYANLGTFYLHKGELDQGIEYIRKALAINPNAHFGREEYQLRLAEFYRDAKANPNLLQTDNFLHVDFEQRVSLGSLMRGNEQPIEDLGLKPNVFDGVAGMIRFGTGTSAELYYVLGELLGSRGQRHAAYASFRRAVELNHPRAVAIRERMRSVARRVEGHKDWDDELITRERAEADAWVAAYQSFETDLIHAGKDPDDPANFRPFYDKYGPPVLHTPATNVRRFAEGTLGFALNSPAGYAALAITALVLLWLASLIHRRRRRNRLASPRAVPSETLATP